MCAYVFRRRPFPRTQSTDQTCAVLSFKTTLNNGNSQSPDFGINGGKCIEKDSIKNYGTFNGISDERCYKLNPSCTQRNRMVISAVRWLNFFFASLSFTAWLPRSRVVPSSGMKSIFVVHTTGGNKAPSAMTAKICRCIERKSCTIGWRTMFCMFRHTVGIPVIHPRKVGTFVKWQKAPNPRNVWIFKSFVSLSLSLSLFSFVFSSLVNFPKSNMPFHEKPNVDDVSAMICTKRKVHVYLWRFVLAILICWRADINGIWWVRKNENRTHFTYGWEVEKSTCEKPTTCSQSSLKCIKCNSAWFFVCVYMRASAFEHLLCRWCFAFDLSHWRANALKIAQQITQS